MGTPPSQTDVCKRYGMEPQAPLAYDRLGIALATLQTQPINGLLKLMSLKD